MRIERWGPMVMNGGFGLWWIVGAAVFVLFWGLVIAALVLGIRWLIRADRGGQGGPVQPTGRGPAGWVPPGVGAFGGSDVGSADALDILRQRYARGEIDDLEFERRRAVLMGALTVPPPAMPPPAMPPPSMPPSGMPPSPPAPPLAGSPPAAGPPPPPARPPGQGPPTAR